MILADGKNKGLPFSKNNVAGRKASNGKKMEVVLGADCYPTAPFPPPPWVCPRGEWARADRRGKVTFSYFVRTNANTTNVFVCTCMHKVTVNCFHRGRLFKFPNEKKSTSRIPWGSLLDRRALFIMYQGFWSRAVCPGESVGTTRMVQK